VTEARRALRAQDRHTVECGGAGGRERIASSRVSSSSPWRAMPIAIAVASGATGSGRWRSWCCPARPSRSRQRLIDIRASHLHQVRDRVRILGAIGCRRDSSSRASSVDRGGAARLRSRPPSSPSRICRIIVEALGVRRSASAWIAAASRNPLSAASRMTGNAATPPCDGAGARDRRSGSWARTIAVAWRHVGVTSTSGRRMPRR
jgi:hypothetical protein